MSSIKEKHRVDQTTLKQIVFREPTENDGAAMYEIVKNSRTLDLNSSYSYLMFGKFFNKTSIVAEENGEVIGFITGFKQPNSPNTLFIWQIAVDPDHRGKGIASRLISTLLKKNEVKYLEATVTPSNLASSRLFKRIAKDQQTTCKISTCFHTGQFPSSNHEDELTYRIGPLQNNK